MMLNQRFRSLALAVLYAGICSAARPDQPPANQLTPAAALLQEARGIAKNFSIEEQADFLLDLAKAYRDVDKSQIEQISLELLYLCHNQMQPGPYRAAMEKNALTALALVNPERAAHLYRIQELPQENPMTEDRRSFGTQILFPELLRVKGLSALPEIRSLATWLGETGQYPYAGIALVIKNIAKANPEGAEGLFYDAIGFLPRDPGFVNTNWRFVAFLLSTHALVSTVALRAGIEQALNAIDKSSRNPVPMKVQVTSGKNTFGFGSEQEYLAYRLLPLAEAVDSHIADRIKGKYKSLQGIPEAPIDSNVAANAAVSLDAGTNSGGTQAALEAALNEHRLMQMKGLINQDPQLALQTVHLIGDRGQQAVALAELQSAYRQIDPKTANSWSKQITDQLQSLPPGLTKLQLLVALAESQRPETAMGRGYASKALDLGNELLSHDLRSNPGKMAYATTGFDELQSLAQSYAEDVDDATWMLDRVRQLENDILRARLMVVIARGKGMHSAPETETLKTER